MTKAEKERWYQKGLKFKCTGCGACCTGSPGYVFLTEIDEKRIADALNISIETFQKKYTRMFLGRRSLIEDPKNYDCVFLKNNQCSLYEARPKQCRTYPFWSGILQSRQNWEEEKKYCEGIESKEAIHFPANQIDEISNS